MAAPRNVSISDEQVDAYHRDGYLIVRALFDPATIAEIKSLFDDIAERGEPIPGHWNPKTSTDNEDPLERYPRIGHPHRFDRQVLAWLVDPRFETVLGGLLGEEPLAAQSMYYYKPPGARGQAFHQDNFYLKVAPGTCIAAWLAIDSSTPENGGLQVVPGTQGLDILCPDPADVGESFTSHLVRPPEGLTEIPTELSPGDCLFFNGSLIHGSGPNRHQTSWRRSFICHYMPASSREIAGHYKPLLDFSGQDVDRAEGTGGGPCGDEVPMISSYGRAN